MAIDKISGLGRFAGEVVKEKSPPEMKVAPSSITPLNFRVMVGGRLIPNARVNFRLKGNTNGATLANDSLNADENGMVTVNLTAGTGAADFLVIASSNGKDVDANVRVFVVANIQAAAGTLEVSFATNVPPDMAIKIAYMAKNNPREALQMLAEYDDTVKRALQMGHGEAIARIADSLEIARSTLA